MTDRYHPAHNADTRMGDDEIASAKTIKMPVGGSTQPPRTEEGLSLAMTAAVGTEAQVRPSAISTAPPDPAPDDLLTAPGANPSPTLDTPTLAPPQPARWGEHEPEDRTFKVDHVHADQLPGASGWKIAGASIRGKMHAHDGRYRDDYWLAATTPNGAYNLIAVADGGGSYPLARIGAKVATQCAIATLQEGLPADEIKDKVIRVIVATALEAAAEGLAREAAHIAQRLHGTTVKDLSTTLLLVVHHPQSGLLVTGQIGDGLILVGTGDEGLKSLGEAEVGLAAGEVVFLNNTDGNWLRRVQLTPLPGPPRFIAVMTDGLADDVVETARNQAAFVQGITENLYTPTPENALLQLLRYEKRGSFDDRTLVVAYPEHPAGDE